MDPMPLAGEFSASRQDAECARRYPLTWVQCPDCTLVQVLEDVDDEGLFSAYHYASSTVPGLVRHFGAYARHLEALVAKDKARVLEIGCNDGVLLRQLPSSWDRTGVDPSDVARTAAIDGYRLVPEPFTSALADQLLSDGPFELVTSSNTLAHVTDLGDVFAGVASVLSDDGIFSLEVHDLDATLESGQWDTIYHEHKVEWSERSLALCLARAGLQLVEVARTPMHGGALRVAAKLAVRDEVPVTAEDSLREVRGLDHLRDTYTRRRRSAVYGRLEQLLGEGRPLCAYGASGRANVWLNQLPELRMEFIVDDAPLRNGRWLPGVAVPVVSASRLYEMPTSGCLITAWNYAEDIEKQHPAYPGSWFVAFPQ